MECGPRAAGGPRDSPPFRATRAAVRLLLRALFRVRTEGFERIPPGRAVIVANHLSWLDPILLPTMLPRKAAILAMAELWRMPVVGAVMRAYGPLAIPLRRRGADMRALRRALAALQDDRLLLVFPEGGISPDGTLRPFQGGAALLAARARAPLFPVAVIGTREALPLERIVPRLRRVTLRAGSAIPVPDDATATLDRATQDARSQIEALLQAR